MTTINIHKDKLLPAAFAYQQRKLKEIMNWQEDVISKAMDKPWPFRPKSRFAAAKHIQQESYTWARQQIRVQDIMSEYVKLQTACRVAEGGIVSLDIDVVQRIFGEEL